MLPVGVAAAAAADLLLLDDELLLPAVGAPSAALTIFSKSYDTTCVSSPSTSCALSPLASSTSMQPFSLMLLQLPMPPWLHAAPVQLPPYSTGSWSAGMCSSRKEEGSPEITWI